MPKSCLIVALALLLDGCACSNPDNMPLLSSLARRFEDEPHSATRAAALFFVGTPAAVIDVALLHPIQCVDDAACESYDLVGEIWKNPHGGITTQAFLFVPKVVVTPVVGIGNFALSWTFRSLFDLAEHPSHEGSDELEPDSVAVGATTAIDR